MSNAIDLEKRAIFWAIAILVLTISTRPISAETTAAVFEMEEVCVFDDPGISGRFISGVGADTDFEPLTEVKSYPVFKSEKVLYGSVRLGRELFRPESGKLFYFAIDQSEGTDTGYDRFYFDLNGDSVLAKDEVLSAQDAPPEGALGRITSAEKHICFEHLTLSLDSSSADLLPVEIMPRLTLLKDTGRLMRFVAAKARKGPVEIAGHKYNAFLGHPYFIYPAYDHPGTSLYLIPEKGPTHSSLFMNFLITMHQIDGKLYCFSAAPDGSKITVKPYDGKFGTFKIRYRQLLGPNKNIYGALASNEAIVQIGSPDNLRDGKKLSSVKILVGDYLPMHLNIYLDNMLINISDNYHSDGKPRDGSKEKVFGIKIREDKPFVLNFANDPEVIIATPAKDAPIKPGDELKVAAVLIDPILDIMIRGLAINRDYGEVFLSIRSHMLIVPLFVVLLLVSIFLRKLRRRYRILLSLASVIVLLVIAAVIIILYSMVPKEGGYSSYSDIIPQVTVKNATGRIVASGSMPFG